MDRWKESLYRFKHIFGLDAQGKYTDKQVYYIPGNHDIGYESLHYAKPEVFQHFIAQLLMFKLQKGCFRWYVQYIAMKSNAKLQLYWSRNYIQDLRDGKLHILSF